MKGIEGLTPLIPKGETACVWMEAGVVRYKLCDTELGCESCPFDRAMRRQGNSDASFLGPCGLRMYPGLFYHPRHLWVMIEERGEVRLGLDDFAQRLLGSVERLILPKPGLRIEANPPRVFARGMLLTLAAPIHGEVIQENRSLIGTLSLIHGYPYTRGWLVRIAPSRLKEDLERLAYGHGARRWLQEECGRLTGFFSKALSLKDTLAGPTLQDGGVPLLEAIDQFDARTLKEAVRLFLV